MLFILSPLKGVTYNLAQFHLHWAKESAEGGSEHTFDEKQFFAEVSFLLYFYYFNKLVFKYKTCSP